MMSILEFIFSSFWVWFGSFLILSIFAQTTVKILGFVRDIVVALISRFKKIESEDEMKELDYEIVDDSKK